MDVWVEGSAHPPAQVDSTATGVFGLSPLHSVCVGEMFLVPEGMKGLGLVSMATGRKSRRNKKDELLLCLLNKINYAHSRLAPLTRNNFGVIQTLEIPAPARSHPRWILQELRIPVTSLLNLSTQCGLSFYPPPIWSSLT